MNWSPVDLKTKKVLCREGLGTTRNTGVLGSHIGVPIKTGVPILRESIIAAHGIGAEVRLRNLFI